MSRRELKRGLTTLTVLGSDVKEEVSSGRSGGTGVAESGEPTHRVTGGAVEDRAAFGEQNEIVDHLENGGSGLVDHSHNGPPRAYRIGA